MNALPKTSRGGTLQKDPFSSKVTLSCNEGYKLPDIITSELVNGNWDPPQLDCLPLSELTELPKTSVGGNVTCSSQSPYHFNDEATLKCDDGYGLPFTHTSKVIVENGFLKWKPSQLSCNPVNCFPPLEIDNGKVIPEKRMYYFTDSVEFICNPGFNLQSTRSKHYCSVSGWQPPIHSENIRCFQDPEWCPELKTPENGSLRLSNGRNYESVASFACNYGFVLNGGETRTCQSDKTWSDGEITCKFPFNCPPMPSNIISFFKNTHYLILCKEKASEWITVQCIDGQWEYEYEHQYCNGMDINSLLKSPVKGTNMDNNLLNVNRINENAPPLKNNNVSIHSSNTHKNLPSPPVHNNVFHRKIPSSHIEQNKSYLKFAILGLIVILSVIVFLVIKAKSQL